LRSDTCVIDTDNLFKYSFAGEVLSSIKYDSLAIFSFICALGYEARVNLSEWFSLLETIYVWGVSIGVAGCAYAVYKLSNVKLYIRLTVGWILIVYGVSIVFTKYGLVYGYLINSATTLIYMYLVYFLCSSGLYVRAYYFFLWYTGSVLLGTIILIMLRFKLWTAILFAITPADYIINTLVVLATKTCDRILYLQSSAIVYCAIFENIRYLSLSGIIEEEMG